MSSRVAALLAALVATAAMAAVPVPKLEARVTDLAGTLTAPQREALEAKLRDFETRRGSQVAVLIVPSIGDEPIEEFAGRVTDEWKLGRKGVDDGVLFAIAMKERRMRIQTGRGVQGTLTDVLSKRIVSDLVTPHFRNGDFAGGIDAGADAIMKAIEGEDLPLPKPASHGKVDSQSSFGDLAILALFGVPILGMVMRSMFGRFFGATATSGIAGIGAWLLLGSLAVGIVAAIFAFLFTLIVGAGAGRSVGRRGWGGFIPGGFGGGSWGGGGGGGGFSGGGGGFDGGGASGSW
ncbi:MAG TPA: TPM domain-containing protein [Usitatibacter sp.]|nr:TPM domain-containing protein [Usitatibacter sp.]